MIRTLVSLLTIGISTLFVLSIVAFCNMRSNAKKNQAVLVGFYKSSSKNTQLETF